MSTTFISDAIHDLRNAVLRDGGGITDAELLERFVRQRDAGALAALIRRHAPMVWSVCRRVLASHHDAEDAFQATFLVLVRKAASVRQSELLANWLYGVAQQTAIRARSAAIKHGVRERQVSEMPEPAAADQDLWDSIQPLLDQELSGLPEKYRATIVLCDLQGKSRKEAAEELACPEGTVAGRLARARAMLAKRLARRGVTVSAALLGVALGTHAVSAGMPTAVVSTTIEAATLCAAGHATAGVISANAVALSEGVMKAMLISKLKFTAACLLVLGVLATGGWFAARHSLAAAAPEHHAFVNNAAPALEPEVVDQERAQRPQPKADGVTVTGKLEAVDAQKVSVALPPPMRGAAPVVKAYDLAKDAKFQRDGKDVKFAELKTGAQATLKLSADQKLVVSVTQTTPAVSSPLKSVDATKNTITITVGNRLAREDKTYSVAKDAKITIDGKDAKLADLKEGTPVTVVLEQNTVTQIRVAARKERKQDE